MNKFLPAAFLSLSVLFCTAIKAQTTFKVASWNIEWFGSTTQAPNDDNLQEANVKTVLRYLNADIYGLAEVVDTMRFRRLADSLGSNFKYVISDFCSNNTTGTGNAWLTGQKLGFIYNKNIFTNVKVRGLLKTSATGYTNFASGRFPYLFTADVTLNGITKNFNFILLHGKAGSTQSDYDKRKAGAQELKDTLDASFSTANTIMIGDYNDALNTTICSGCTSNVSSYDAFVKDSTDNDHYRSITMPLANLGLTTMINFPNVIDNHIISNEVESMYVPGSIAIRTDVTNIVANYLSDNTSDHYPVTSQYNLSGAVTSIPGVDENLLTSIYPNPFASQFVITAGHTVTNATLLVQDANGKLVYSEKIGRLTKGSSLSKSFGNLPKGVYVLTLLTKEGKEVKKIVKM